RGETTVRPNPAFPLRLRHKVLMHMMRTILSAALLAAVASLFPLAASAQAPNYFIPGQQRAPAAAPARPTRPQPPPSAPAQVVPEQQQMQQQMVPGQEE